METAEPWVGHSGKLRKRCQLHGWNKQAATNSQFKMDKSSEVRTPGSVTVTRQRCQVNKRVRFQFINSPGTVPRKLGGRIVGSREIQEEFGKYAEAEVAPKTPCGRWLD